MNSLTKVPTAKELLSKYQQLGANLIEFARELVGAIDAIPERKQELVEAGFAPAALDRLERLGRGSILPQLVFATTPGAEKVLKLSLSDQRQALEHGIEVMDEDEETTRNIPLHDLTRPQAKQVFGPDGIRSLAQQRTLIRDRKAKLLPVAPKDSYRVTKDFVVTSAPGKWPRSLILQWLAEMG